MQFVIYSKDNCPNCEKAKALLIGEGYPPKIVKVGEDISREAFFIRCNNAKTLPQVELNGKHIGGFMQLKHIIKNLMFNTDFQDDF